MQIACNKLSICLWILSYHLAVLNSRLQSIVNTPLIEVDLGLIVLEMLVPGHDALSIHTRDTQDEHIFVHLCFWLLSYNRFILRKVICKLLLSICFYPGLLYIVSLIPTTQHHEERTVSGTFHVCMTWKERRILNISWHIYLWQEKYFDIDLVDIIFPSLRSRWHE